MSIINKVTSRIAKLGVMYEIAKHNNRKDITKHIKQSLKKLTNEVSEMLKTKQTNFATDSEK